MDKQYLDWLVVNSKVRDEIKHIAADLTKYRSILDVAAKDQNNVMIGGAVMAILADVNKLVAMLGDERALSQTMATILEENKGTLKTK